MNIQKLAKQIAETLNIQKAYSYDLFYRDYDDMVELVGLVDDPTYDIKDFQGREMLFPKKWVTLEVLNSNYGVKV
jgi:hypothetical protein